MTIYQVWAHDPMASSMGEDVIDKSFTSKEAAEHYRNTENEKLDKWWAHKTGRNEKYYAHCYITTAKVEE